MDTSEQQEIWKECIEGYYEVSSFGNVRSMTRIINSCHGTPAVRKGRPMKSFLNPKGYLVLRLFVLGVTVTRGVHRLVAETFLGEPANSDMVVDHIDENKLNNRLNNLQWLTSNENKRKSMLFRRNTGATKVGTARLTPEEKVVQQLHQHEHNAPEGVRSWAGVTLVLPGQKFEP